MKQSPGSPTQTAQAGVAFDSLRIYLFDAALDYQSYWLNCVAEDAQGNLRLYDVMQKLLQQWAIVLDAASANQTLYLPYDLDDEYTDCLAARVSIESVTLYPVRLTENGFLINPFDLREFVAHSNSRLIEQVLGVTKKYRKARLIHALANAAFGEYPKIQNWETTH